MDKEFTATKSINQQPSCGHEEEIGWVIAESEIFGGSNRKAKELARLARHFDLIE